MENMLVDSTVLIQFFRNSNEAKDFLSNTPEQLSISRIVLMEIQTGLKSKAAATKAENQIRELDIEIIEVDSDISYLASQIFFEHHYTQGIGMMDAFIAATASVKGEKLVTHNVKHFKFIKGLELVIPY